MRLNSVGGTVSSAMLQRGHRSKIKGHLGHVVRMGKIKGKKSLSKSRPRPTGLPSVREAEEEMALEKPEPQESSSLPLLEKLGSQSAADREWACRSLCHVVFDPESIRLLLQHRLFRRVAPLLVDKELGVREAAAGALRNLSVCGSGEFCEQMVSEDVMTPLAVMLRECVSHLQKLGSAPPPLSSTTLKPTDSSSTTSHTSSKGKKAKASKPGPSQGDKEVHTWRITREELAGVSEQGLHLLWNLAESSPIIVEVFNREGLLPVLLFFLQPDSFPPSLVVVAAQCLHTISEDNSTALRSLSSSPSSLSNMEQLLVLQPMDPSCWSLVLKASIAGVFQNLLPFLSEPVSSQTLRGILSLLSSILDLDVSSLLHTLSSTPPPTPPQASEQATGSAKHSENKTDTETNTLYTQIENTLRAQRLALETLANLCYTENEEEWEDVEEEEEEEVEEMVGGEEEMLMEAEDMGQQSSSGALSPVLSLVLELGLHEKVWKTSSSVSTTEYQLCSTINNGETLAKSLSMVRTRSLTSLQNLLSSVPVDGWGGDGKLNTLWGSLFPLLEAGGRVLADSPDAVTGVLTTLMNKLNSVGANCVTGAQLGLLSRLGVSAEEPSVRVDVMTMMGIAGKMTLRMTPPDNETLMTVGATLRDCVSADSSLWVVSQALDSLFDVFGDDNCPPSIFTALNLMPVLRNMASMFKARLRVEKKALDPTHLALVNSSRLNLPRFLQYMAKRTT